MRTDATATTTPTKTDVLAQLREVFESGRTRRPQWRAAQLRGIEQLVSQREARIVEALDADLRRPPFEAWMGDIMVTAHEASYARRHLRGWMRPNRTRLPLVQLPARASVRHEPLGTALIVGAWNYPIYLCLAPLVAAVAAGNCAVVKPSEMAPATSALLAELVPQFLDGDAIRVVEGGADTTQHLLSLGFDHALFTGGTEVGKRVMAAAAETLTPVTLELGGKNPVVVTREADLEVAARRIAWLKIVNSGQTCIAPDYVIAEEGVRDELVAELSRYLAAFGGAGTESWSPIVNRRHYDRLTDMISSSRGTIVRGGGADPSSLRIEPTIIVDPDSSDNVMSEEIFGPVLPVVTVKSIDDAVSFIKARPKPLALYVFSSPRVGQDIVDRVPSGGAVINHIAVHCMMPQLPFGGIGASGIGAYHGRWGFKTFSHRRAVVTTSARPDPRLVYPPYRDWAWRILRKVL
ncbi:aldehyde dehydrogenase family protein [Mycobacterium sp.]|jgi:aldehyde dehydrogenase (NAD+)|uniref:aldehyde dehydrogenase family protein n=1 Tax=Mycobacterium sp. TaxID=1785 RepID=UPI00333E1A61|nr:fatty aldehyde dehydrogenase [Mycobacterium sp.]